MPWLVRWLKETIQGNDVLRRALYNPCQALGYALPTGYRREWVERIADVMACPDLNDIPRAAGAGTVRRGLQIMHTGQRVIAGGYYGYPVVRMMSLSGGVHEPQEEKAFGIVLDFIPPGGIMIELGAYWAFYSLWFQQRVPAARNYIVEPSAGNIEIGRTNFTLNGMRATFLQEGVGSPPLSTVDDLLARQRIDFVHMLHADIQGAEHEMLLGARCAFADKRIGYVFISTHSEKLHGQCRTFLLGQGLTILADAAPAESYSFDGLLVARSESMPGPDRIEISKKHAACVA